MHIRNIYADREFDEKKFIDVNDMTTYMIAAGQTMEKLHHFNSCSLFLWSFL